MTTAIDTNVLFDVLRPNPAWQLGAQRALRQQAAVGALVICDVVLAELCAYFESLEMCLEFLDCTHIAVEHASPEACWVAGQAFSAYRLRQGPRERILPDFLIGAHAQVQASRLLTRDRGFYGARFPHLTLLDPSQG